MQKRTITHCLCDFTGVVVQVLISVIWPPHLFYTLIHATCAFANFLKEPYMTYSNQGRFVQEFVFFSRQYQGRHFYDAAANEHASRMAATPCPITYVQVFPE